MTNVFDIVLLLALPASGKSEVRKYLASLPASQTRSDFHMGPTVQLDDFPYVHVMRRIDEELRARGRDGVFFQAPDRSFSDTWDWGTLIQLVNEDYADLVARREADPASPAGFVFDRLDAAAKRAGATAKLGGLEPRVRTALEQALEVEAAELLRAKHAIYPDNFKGKTVVIEFARGGPHGSAMPLPAPWGYQHSLGQLSPEILRSAVVLYVWVTPEESRRKNVERADPNDPGSILHHSVPEAVMLGDYGCDDMDWLIAESDIPDTIRVAAAGETFHLPVGRFDNRQDKTSFIRKPKARWLDTEVGAIHAGLADAIARLVKARKAIP